MNPWQPPHTNSIQDPAADPTAVLPPPVVRWAGIVVLANGGFLWAMALQLTWFFSLQSLGRVSVGLLVAHGLIALWLGPSVGKGQTWATVGATVNALVASLSATVWLITSTLSGAFSPLIAFGSLSSAAACLLALVSIPAAARVSAARRDLYD